MNPLNALANPWTYKRNHSPSHHSPRFRSPKFGKRSPIPVGGTSPQLPLPAEPISALPPLLPNGPSSLTSPLDGLGGLPSIITNANATVVDGGSGSVPLMGGLNGGVTIGTIVGKRKRSHSDAPPQRVTETSHEHVESGSGLGLDVGLELGLGLGGYQEDDRTYTYEHYNPHDNTGNDNGLGTKHPHARPAAPPSAKPTKNNRLKPNHGDKDIHEDIHKHIHEHIHNSKRDDGAGGVPGTVDIVVRPFSLRFHLTHADAIVVEHAKQHETRISDARYRYCERYQREREHHRESLRAQRIRDESNNSLPRRRL